MYAPGCTAMLTGHSCFISVPNLSNNLQAQRAEVACKSATPWRIEAWLDPLPVNCAGPNVGQEQLACVSAASAGSPLGPVLHKGRLLVFQACLKYF